MVSKTEFFLRASLAVLLVLLLASVSMLLVYLLRPDEEKAPLREEFTLDEIEEMEFSSDIERGAVLGAHWFGRVQREDGTYVYIFDPDNNTEIEKYSYSIARHCGSIYPMVWAHRHTDDIRYLECAELAGEYVIERIGSMGGGIRYVDTGSRSSLFNNALALIGMCYLHNETGDARYTEYIRGLADLCMASQDEEGRFDYKFETSGENPFDEHPMASGEAMLGLALAYRETGALEYLIGLLRSADHYSARFTDNNCAEMRTDVYSWMASAFSEAYLLSGNESYKEAAYDMTDWMIDHHFGSFFKVGGKYDTSKMEEYPDCVGSFRTYPSMNSCTYCEGMGDVLGIAVEEDDRDQIDRYTDVLLNASGFILNLMYDQDEAFDFGSPELVLGGYRHDLFDRVNEDGGWQSRWIRIDYTQHAIGALFRMIDLIPEDILSEH